jgi:predicted GNAT family acetyltransferase
MTTDQPPLQVQHDDHLGAGQGEFFIEKDGARVGRMTYHRAGDTVTIQHTEVGDALKGQGAGKRLLEQVVAWARQDHLHIVPRCPFARATFVKHPELRDVLAKDVAL